MSNEGNKKMHASCYLAIAIAYTVSVVAYAILAVGAFKEERRDIHAEPPAATELKVGLQPTLPAQAE